MASRAMQAKRLKMKRAKRLFPKNYQSDYIPCGAPPNRLVIREYKERAAGLAFDAKYMEELEKRARFRGVPPGRKEAIDLMTKIMAEEPTILTIKLMDTPKLRAILLFTSEMRHFRVSETNKLNGETRVSMKYGDKDRCIDRWKTDTIRWVEFSSSPPVIS